jgi:hypothetical protein
MLMGMPIEQLWDTLTGQFVVVFDDGELVTNARETLYSAYAWEFHRRYPKTPLLKHHHHTHILNNKRTGSDSHTDLLGNVMWSVYDVYAYDPSTGMSEQDLRDVLSEMVYRIGNQMYNALTHACEEDVVSLDITDFMQVLANPRVRAANEALEPTQRSIMDTYAEIKDVLQGGVELPNNPISIAVRAKLVNINQVLQCVSARGFLTDTDSEQFRVPVLRGYAQGLRLFHDSLIESRSAAKSLIFSKAPLQQAEYFSRRLQLMSQIVERLHPGDCGTDKYLHFLVRGPTLHDGQVTHGGDLRQLHGMNYLDEATGTLKKVRNNDKHLIGKTIKLRSPTHCAHSDAYGICATCFGELSLSVPAGTNIGHMCCTSMTQKSSQNVLSVKHLDGSAVVEAITIGDDERRFLKVGADENSYGLSDQLIGKKVTLVIAAERAINITDVKEVQRVEDLNPTRVSELEEITLIVETTLPNGNVLVEEPSIYVHLQRRLASMTYPLLAHIKAKGWGVNEKGDYTIDMEGFDWSKPILELPLKHINMSDHSRDIAEMLESSVDEMQERDKGISPDVLLVRLYDLVNDKLSVNLAVLAVILYGAMIVSAEEGDYSLPKPWTSRGLGVMSMSMAYRSMAAAMAYENHRDMITSPLSYIHTNRPDHPMDGILCPSEVFGHVALPGSLPQAVTNWGVRAG